MSGLMFTDLVAVVTGSGGGLGRNYALELAKRGAKVIVNDLGVLRNGESNDLSPANKVVNEIKSFGGIAYPNYDSVENGDKIIECAIKTFGKIDILINNAGILRDKSFSSMSVDDWNRVVNVHLFGAFVTTKSAWNFMREQKFGRIIFTSSASGIYGNFGQANYSAAKLGLVGLCKTLSIEGAKYGINCNTVAPVAGSRMTEDLLPQEIFDALKVEYVSPLVLYLCHPSCTESGSLFEVGAGWVGKLRWEAGGGVNLKNSKSHYFNVEDVQNQWDKICDFSNPQYPSSARESFDRFIDVIQQNETEKPATVHDVSNAPFSLENIVGISRTVNLEKITFKDAILYAISVGINNSKIENLKFLYENHSQFCVLPTYAVVACFDGFFGIVDELMDSSRVNFDLSQVLHAEQYLEVIKPLKLNEKYSIHTEIVDVIDKTRGAIILLNVNMYNLQKELVSKLQYSIYASGAGGFNGKSKSNHEFPIKPHPNKNPDVVIENYIDSNLPVLYRLNGDFNPLHIDPEFSSLAGYKIPILHGLCSFGIISQQAINIFAGGNVEKFKRIKVRFSKPVVPGQTVITSFWREMNIIYFQSKIKETGLVCLSGGYVEFLDDIMKPKL